MLQKTKEYMKQHQMPGPGEKIVLGLSGGADSVCLFHLLRTLGYDLEAVHVHHGIRGAQADRDEAFVKELCESYSIPIHGFYFDVPAISKERHLSLEEAGRMVRRKAFSEVKESCSANYIALAHHGNDRAETFLFHLSRGTGAKGLGSIQPVQGEYIRPLLWAGRKEIEKYLKDNGFSYVEDETNRSEEYTRNKIRHQVLPVLEEINPKAVEHICGAADKLSAVSAYIDREAEKLCRLSTIMYQGEVKILKFAFFQGDEVLLVPVLQKCVEYLAGSLSDFTQEHFQRVLKLFGMQTGKEVHLPKGIRAVRTYEGITMKFFSESGVQEAVKITGEGTYQYGGLTFEISIEPWDERKMFPIKNYTKCFDYDKIKESLFLRTRKSGDFLEIDREHRKKSLQDYMVNEKIPKEERDRVILLGSGNHILWVVGKRISEYYKITRETKRVLKVQVNGGNVYEQL